MFPSLHALELTSSLPQRTIIFKTMATILRSTWVCEGLESKEVLRTMDEDGQENLRVQNILMFKCALTMDRECPKNVLEHSDA